MLLYSWTCSGMLAIVTAQCSTVLGMRTTSAITDHVMSHHWCLPLCTRVYCPHWCDISEDNVHVYTRVPIWEGVWYDFRAFHRTVWQPFCTDGSANAIYRKHKHMNNAKPSHLICLILYRQFAGINGNWICSVLQYWHSGGGGSVEVIQIRNIKNASEKMPFSSPSELLGCHQLRRCPPHILQHVDY